ncbi:hypothetical protein EYF80_025360 [Liparis tanakae]|uniref:Uncharacterized protein n=1 Tax=Liparis tanakae TaxID=230148 RepID=A0A4Z2HFU7_9TELE|nr:hypothetical protein EYF80_025360 [Liparis tanakae]
MMCSNALASTKTSSPAPPHCPDSNALSRAASSMIPPRAQFTTFTPFLHFANSNYSEHFAVQLRAHELQKWKRNYDPVQASHLISAVWLNNGVDHATIMSSVDDISGYLRGRANHKAIVVLARGEEHWRGSTLSLINTVWMEMGAMFGVSSLGCWLAGGWVVVVMVVGGGGGGGGGRLVSVG